VEEYDPATDTWTPKAGMPIARSMMTASVVNGKIYAIGGSIGAGRENNVATVEEYEPYPVVVDFNGDEIVDSKDVSIMVDHWHTDNALYDIAPRPFGDGIVDVQDLILLSEHLFEEILPPGLIAYWKLDEVEGIIAYDSAEYQDGYLIGDPVWRPAEGKRDGALEFDGIDDYIITDFVLDPADGPFSVFAWIKGGAPGQVILSPANGRNWLSVKTATGVLMTELIPSLTVKSLSSQAVITDDEWHRVGLSWDDRSDLVLYIDGVEVARNTQSGVPGSSGSLYIGTSKTLAPGTFFSGLIDDVRIYRRALSADEIAFLAQ
jgi:hypothetical protein